MYVFSDSELLSFFFYEQRSQMACVWIVGMTWVVCVCVDVRVCMRVCPCCNYSVLIYVAIFFLSLFIPSFGYRTLKCT